MKQLLLLVLTSSICSVSFAQKGEQFYENAIDKLEQEDYIYALGLIDRAIQEDSIKGKYYIAKAKILNQAGRLDEVETQIVKAVEVEPDALSVNIEAAEYYRAQSQLEKSVYFYDKAIELFPEERLSILVEKADAYRFMRDFDIAKQILDDVLEEDPDHLAALHNYSIIYSFLGDTQKAIEYTKRVVEQQPDNSIALMNIGYFYTIQGEPEQSLPYFDKSIALDPENPFLYNNRGYAYYLLERYDEALVDVEKSIHLFESNSYAYKNLGLIYIAKGMNKEACKALNFASNYGFEINYGPEVNELIEEHCSSTNQ